MGTSCERNPIWDVRGLRLEETGEGRLGNGRKCKPEQRRWDRTRDEGVLMNANRNLFFVFGEKKNLKVKRSKSLPKNKPLLPKQEGALPGALFPLAMHYCSPVQLWEFRSSLCVSRSKKILSFLQGGKMPNKKLIVFFLQSFWIPI